jgi:hypothetical protein
METLLIALLVVVLFMEHGGAARLQILAATRTNTIGVIKYFGSAAVLSLTLSSLPVILLSIYMRSNGFFAYEIFGSQQHSVQILSFNVFLNFLVLSVFLFGAWLLWGAKADKASLVISSIGTIGAVITFVLVAISTRRYDLVISVFVLCFLLSAYLYFWVSSGFSQKARFWWIPLAFSLIFLLAPVVFYRWAVLITENALSQMNVGGIDVELSDPLGFGAQSKISVTARLILRTPEFYYLRFKSDPEQIVIVGTEHVSLRYKPK